MDGREIMNSIAEDVFLRSLGMSCYEGGKERRPYHRQCSCALHKRKQAGSNACFHGTQLKMVVGNKAWYHCSLSVEYSSLLQRNNNLNVLRIGRIDQWMSIYLH